MQQSELKKILELHQQWLETNGEEGERADLYKANVAGAILVDADLENANLQNANLEGALLVDAIWAGAELYKAKKAGAE